jgi:hypothetical protein
MRNSSRTPVTRMTSTLMFARRDAAEAAEPA